MSFFVYLQEMRRAFSRTGWTLTVSLTGGANILDTAYDLPAIVNEIGKLLL